MLKALGSHLKKWLNSISLIQTAAIIVASFGGAWLLSEVTHILGNVTGHWLWIEGMGWFVLFASSFIIVHSKELAKNPPLHLRQQLLYHYPNRKPVSKRLAQDPLMCPCLMGLLTLWRQAIKRPKHCSQYLKMRYKAASPQGMSEM